MPLVACCPLRPVPARRPCAWLLSALLLLVGLTLAAPRAHADSALLNLTVPPSGDCTGSCQSLTSFGTIALNLNTNGTITVAIVMANPDIQFGSGAGGTAIAFNVVGSTQGLAVSGLPTSWGWETGDSSSIGSFGDFNFMVSINGNNNSDTLSSLTFTVSRTGGFTSVNDLLGLSDGSTPANFVLHLKDMATGNTWYEGAVSAPEPSSLLLSSLGLLMLGMVIGVRRRRQLAGARPRA